MNRYFNPIMGATFLAGNSFQAKKRLKNEVEFILTATLRTLLHIQYTESLKFGIHEFFCLRCNI